MNLKESLLVSQKYNETLTIEGCIDIIFSGKFKPEWLKQLLAEDTALTRAFILFATKLQYHVDFIELRNTGNLAKPEIKSRYGGSPPPYYNSNNALEVQRILDRFYDDPKLRQAFVPYAGGTQFNTFRLRLKQGLNYLVDLMDSTCKYKKLIDELTCRTIKTQTKVGLVFIRRTTDIKDNEVVNVLQHQWKFRLKRFLELGKNVFMLDNLVLQSEDLLFLEALSKVYDDTYEIVYTDCFIKVKKRSIAERKRTERELEKDLKKEEQELENSEYEVVSPGSLGNLVSADMFNFGQTIETVENQNETIENQNETNVSKEANQLL